MECDKDMGHINQKVKAILPKDWRSEFYKARKNPSPIKVIDMSNAKFLGIESALQPFLRKKCPFKTRPVREIRICLEKPGYILHRNNWNGEFSLSSPFKANQQQELPQIEFQLAYATAISRAKYSDLQVLKNFEKNFVPSKTKRILTLCQNQMMCPTHCMRLKSSMTTNLDN